MSTITIEALLDAIGTGSPTNLATVLALRDVVRQAAPEALEGVKYGGLHTSPPARSAASLPLPAM